MREEDLTDKGVPFFCNNCGHKPTLQKVIANNAECEICQDEIYEYTIEAAEMILKLTEKAEKLETMTKNLEKLSQNVHATMEHQEDIAYLSYIEVAIQDILHPELIKPDEEDWA